MNIANEIIRSALAAVKALYGQDVPEKMIQLQKTKREFEGHLTLVVFPLLKTSRKKPEETAEDIGRWLVENEPAVASYNVVKGFLNLTVSPQAWLQLLGDINADEHYGEVKPTAEAPLVMIEYSSPNTNKPLHLGHVRNNLLGWSLAQIMQANGNRQRRDAGDERKEGRPPNRRLLRGLRQALPRGGEGAESPIHS